MSKSRSRVTNVAKSKRAKTANILDRHEFKLPIDRIDPKGNTTAVPMIPATRLAIMLAQTLNTTSPELLAVADTAARTINAFGGIDDNTEIVRQLSGQTRNLGLTPEELRGFLDVALSHHRRQYGVLQRAIERLEGIK